MVDRTHILPQWVKEAEYIYASGNSYIDVGFTPNQNTTVEIQMNINSLSGNFVGVFGTETPRFSLYINNTTTSSPKARFDYGDSMITYQTALSKNTDYTIKIDKNFFYINGEKVGEATPSTFTAARSLYLFTTHNSSGAYGTYGKNIKVKRFKVYDNGVLVRDMLSVRNITNNQYGMYDFCRGIFQGSYTTTQFSGGSYS